MSPPAPHPKKGPIGVLAVNLGTPNAPTPWSVARYLREFLMDPFVIDISYVLRALLVHLLILPFRSFASARAYRSIWTSRGSPLKFEHLDFCAALQKELGADYCVQPAMRYQRPSLGSALKDLLKRDPRHVVLLPLYPQYSTATHISTAREVARHARRLAPPNLKFSEVAPFYGDEGYIASWAALCAPEMAKHDFLLLSFHGLPESQIKATDLSKSHCLKKADCCARISSANSHCYRAHCHETARLIAARLGLRPEQWTLSFQSRLAGSRWIEPYTDNMLRELRRRGVKRLAVACPAFVADCLETLEEIGERARHDWLAMGGESLTLIPCPNSHPLWVKAAAALVQRQVE